jgi:uncharacterized protein GlcG (DUF336 family)
MGRLMANITLAQAQAVVSAAIAYSWENKFVNPMAVIVLDARAVPKAYAVEDGSALRRWDFAHGKAYGALAMSVGSKTLATRASANPQMSGLVNNVLGGAMIPVAGAVLIRVNGEIVGCVAVAGDPSPDNDDLAARAGIAAVPELTADPT